MNENNFTATDANVPAAYETPELACFGTLSDLTLAGSASQPEGGSPLPSKHT